MTMTDDELDIIEAAAAIADQWIDPERVRADVSALVAEVKRLRALLGAAPLMLEALEANEEVARLQTPFVAGLNSSDASHEVKQEASDRLGAAQKRWWALRGDALKAARGED